MDIPKDPVILLSYINTALRDTYPSLTELCKSMDLDRDTLARTLHAIGYDYNEQLNKFV